MTLLCAIINGIHQNRSWKRRDIHTTTRGTLETVGANFMDGSLLKYSYRDEQASKMIHKFWPRKIDPHF
jgi:hypothetical protein